MSFCPEKCVSFRFSSQLCICKNELFSSSSSVMTIDQIFDHYCHFGVAQRIQEDSGKKQTNTKNSNRNGCPAHRYPALSQGEWNLCLPGKILTAKKYWCLEVHALSQSNGCLLSCLTVIVFNCVWLNSTPKFVFRIRDRLRVSIFMSLLFGVVLLACEFFLSFSSLSFFFFLPIISEVVHAI